VRRVGGGGAEGLKEATLPLGDGHSEGIKTSEGFSGRKKKKRKAGKGTDFGSKTKKAEKCPMFMQEK